jgi:hypothetical protein
MFSKSASMLPPETATPRPAQKMHVRVIAAYLLLALVLLVGTWLRLAAFRELSVHGRSYPMRDIERAFAISEWKHFPLLGPELINGGWLPGPGFYVLLALATGIGKSFEAVFAFNLLLNLLSLVICFLTVRRHFGLGAALLVTTVATFDIVHMDGVAIPWNPSFIYFFSAVFMMLMFETFLRRNYLCFSLCLPLILFMLQIHMSSIVYLGVLLATLIVFGFSRSARVVIPRRYWIMSLALSLGIMAPYLYSKCTLFQQPPQYLKVSSRNKTWTDVLEAVCLYDTLKRVAYRGIYLPPCSPQDDPGFLTPGDYSDAPERRPNDAWWSISQFITWSYFATLTLAFLYLGYQLWRSRPRSGWQEQGALGAQTTLVFIITFVSFFLLGTYKPAAKIRYLNVLVFPTALLCGFAFSRMLRAFATQPGRWHRLSPGTLALSACTVLATVSVGNGMELWKGIEQRRQDLTGTFSHTKVFYRRVMDTLGIGPEELYHRAFFFSSGGGYYGNKYTPYSSQRLMFAAAHERPQANPRSPTDDDVYYFIARETDLKPQTLKELCIAPFQTDRISFDKDGFPGVTFLVYRYRPAPDRSGYTNCFNPFSTSPETERNLKYVRLTEKVQGYHVVRTERIPPGQGREYVIVNRSDDIFMRLVLSGKGQGVHAWLDTAAPYLSNARLVSLNLIVPDDSRGGKDHVFGLVRNPRVSQCNGRFLMRFEVLAEKDFEPDMDGEAFLDKVQVEFVIVDDSTGASRTIRLPLTGRSPRS